MCLNDDGSTRWHTCPICERKWSNPWFTQCEYPDTMYCVECDEKRLVTRIKKFLGPLKRPIQLIRYRLELRRYRWQS